MEAKYKCAKMNVQKAKYSLGPLPWSKEILEESVWKSFTLAYRYLEEHPCHDFIYRIDSLDSVLGIFRKTERRFSNKIQLFQKKVEDGRIFLRSNRKKIQKFETEFQELIFMFASTAMTLVDQSRALSQKLFLPDYEKKVKEKFSNNTQHKFIQELRVDLIHLRLHKPYWEVSTNSKGVKSSRFLLSQNQLTRRNEYCKLAKAFLRNSPNGINLQNLFKEYSKEVYGFHDWLRAAIDKELGSQIEDYIRCEKIIRAVSSRCHWKVIFSQVISPKKINPFKYLEDYLDKDEMNKVNSLEYKSKEQVDLIIKLIDDDNCCDNELRELIYKGFGL